MVWFRALLDYSIWDMILLILDPISFHHIALSAPFLTSVDHFLLFCFVLGGKEDAREETYVLYVVCCIRDGDVGGGR